MSAAGSTLTAVTKQLPARIRPAAERQCGIVTSSQAIEAGLSRNAIHARVRTGRWQRLHRGVYATFTGEPGRLAVLWAAVLHGGPGAMLSHRTAAEQVGLSDSPSELVHITIPAERRVGREPGIVIHLSARARHALHPVRLPPQTRVEETVLDLADAAGTVDDAVGWVTRALGRRLTTQTRLRAALAQRPRIRWRAELTELLSPDLAGLMSVLERRYHRGVERPHGLPFAARQVRVRRGDRTEYRDVLYEGYATCVELDGQLAHPDETRWRDIGRDNATAAEGGVTLRYGWLAVTTRPCETAAQVDSALRRRGFPGARPCGPGCAVAANATARWQPGPVTRPPAGKHARPPRQRGNGEAMAGAARREQATTHVAKTRCRTMTAGATLGR